LSLSCPATRLCRRMPAPAHLIITVIPQHPASTQPSTIRGPTTIANFFYKKASLVLIELRARSVQALAVARNIALHCTRRVLTYSTSRSCSVSRETQLLFLRPDQGFIGALYAFSSILFAFYRRNERTYSLLLVCCSANNP
jgi:hypothetical protein